MELGETYKLMNTSTASEIIQRGLAAKQEREIYAQMLAMLSDQFYHQTGNNITINKMELADMLTKQTIHGIEIGKNETNL